MFFLSYTVFMNVPCSPSSTHTRLECHSTSPPKHTHKQTHTSTNKQQINPKEGITNQLRGSEMDPQLVLSWGIWMDITPVLDNQIPVTLVEELVSFSDTGREDKSRDRHKWLKELLGVF